MIRRFGLGRALPILLVLIQISFLFWTWAEERHRPIDTSLPMISDIPPDPPPLALKLSIVLNLPAWLLSIPVEMFFSRVSKTRGFLASLPFVALVWYGIGLWLDRFMGYVDPPRKLGRNRRRIAATAAAIFLCLGIAIITPVNHHRGLPSTYWVGGSLILWSTLFLGMSTAGLAHKRNS